LKERDHKLLPKQMCAATSSGAEERYHQGTRVTTQAAICLEPAEGALPRSSPSALPGCQAPRASL